MNNLLTFKYWFSVNPGPLTKSGFIVLVALTALFLIIGILAIILKKKKSLYRGVLNSIYNLCLTNFILGLLFLFFHYENIPFFTARFWFIIWLLGIIVWLVFIIKKIKKIPKKRKELEEDALRKRYLP